MPRTVCFCGFSLAMASAVVLATCGVSSAQSNSLFSNGSNIGRQSASGSMNSGGQSTGRSGSSSSLFNPTDFSLNLGGQSRTSNAGRNGSSLVGDGFIGRTDDTSDFIGRRSTAGGRNATGNQTGNARRGANNSGQRRIGNTQNRQRQNNQNANNQTNLANNGRQQVNRTLPKRMITRHVVDFDAPAVSGSAIETKLDTRFQGAISKRINAKDLKFEVDPDGVLVMRGEVETPQDKDLAARIASMEPGVRGVRNELVVAAVESNPSSAE
ncbi:MAG: BON domain-containing protein [Planctomycetaceae bacterium]